MRAATLAVRQGPYDRAAHNLLLAAAEVAGEGELASTQRRRLALLDELADE